MKRDTDREIREHWFKDHIATYTEQGEIKVLQWKKPGTICYYVRYVFDGCKMYVSGDLGEAVFCFTETAELHIQSRYDLDYFEGKLRAYDGDRRDFDNDKAVKRLREWLKELKEDGNGYDHDNMRELFERARECSRQDDWKFIVNDYSDFISELDQDYWDWMYGIGDEIPLRIQSYLIGLKMAAEQLTAKCA
ncbi:MAG: hypothetical protein JL50_08340 [Peptococcaceae bacterium BICA1-7]|nr:MAG: hypothetical protein JL50_08340 [Peptococcaceae bacterium BICA1-7]HBV97429.1 hypothetical protein [Desulfotomaculum sp.]